MTANTKFRALCLVSFITLWSCKKDDSKLPTVVQETEIKPISKVSISNQNNSFIDLNGNVFFPWGFNYTNPQIIGLIEDNWEQEYIWDIITEDFQEMKTYTANIVRIHLQYHQFMIDADTPNEGALQKLERLVKIAEDIGLYLDITGLAAYRKSDSPEWYNSLNDNERWATQAILWKNIAKAVGESSAVFAFNLMNEPVVSVGCDSNLQCEWLPGAGFGGFHFIQNIARNPDLAFDIAIKDWISLLTNAIRTEDNTTMITVGFLGLGPVTRFVEDLDYLSVHIYPKSGELALSVDKVLDNQSNVPLILEETSNLRCSVEELESFLNQVDGKYNGLMGHYFGKTREELRDSGTIVDALHENFMEFFIANNPN